MATINSSLFTALDLSQERRKEEVMSKTTNMKPGSKKNRVKVGKLQRPEKELKNQEAQSVKGGGGAKAGVDMILRSKETQ